MLRCPVVLLLLATATLEGCTAGLAVGRIVTAQKAVHDAEAKGAPDAAPYEYRLATRSLHEAWEEHGDAQYKTSMAYADQAKAYAEQAIVRTEGGGRELQDLRHDVETLEDVLEGPAPDATAPVAPEPPPKTQREKEVEEAIEDFVDDPGGDDEIIIEDGSTPAPPPAPPPTRTTTPPGKHK